MKFLVLLSTMFLSMTNPVNANTSLPTCTLKTAYHEDGSVLTEYGHLVVPEGLVPERQYFVYASKWASPAGTLPGLIGIFTANDEGAVEIDLLKIEYGDYLLFTTAGQGNWQIPCQ